MTADSQVVQFRVGRDTLLGIAHLPRPATARIGIVIIVGGPQYRVGSHRQFVLAARHFADSGFPVLRYDTRGMGDSGGSSPGFDAQDADIAAAINCIHDLAPGIDGVVLWGLCDAASACLMYANVKDSRVKAMILANPWVRTETTVAKTYLRHYYLQRLLQRSFWRGLITAKFNPLASLGDFLGKLGQTLAPGGSADSNDRSKFIGRMWNGLRAFGRPILLLLSGNDLTAREFSDYCASRRDWPEFLAGGKITQLTVDHADHTFSRRRDLHRVNEVCMQWLDKLMPTVCNKKN